VVVAAQGIATGSIASRAEQELWGAEANAWRNVYDNWPGTTLSVDLMAGFRYLDLDLDIAVRRNTVFASDLSAFPAFLPLAGSRLEERESFATSNRFYGGQVGAAARFYFTDRLAMDAHAKIALGITREEVRIEGSQTRTAPDGTRTVVPAALLALPSQRGRFDQDRFAQVPELGARVRCFVSDHVSLTAGFTALYWSRLVRPAEQLERVANVTQIPNFPGSAAAPPADLTRPTVPFNQSSLWLLGMTFGVEVKF
jgi:hypothetical protein